MIGLHWIAPWHWAHAPAAWFYAQAHDDASFFWRILGLEINIPR